MFGLGTSDRVDRLTDIRDGKEVSLHGKMTRFLALSVLAAVVAGCGPSQEEFDALKKQLDELSGKTTKLEGNNTKEAVDKRTEAEKARAKAIAEEVAKSVVAQAIAAYRAKAKVERTTELDARIAKEKETCGVLDDSSVKAAVHGALEKAFVNSKGEPLTNSPVLKGLIKKFLTKFTESAVKGSLDVSGLDNVGDHFGDAEIKAEFLTLLKANPTHLPYYVKMMIATIQNLPEEKRATVARTFAKLAFEIAKVLPLYAKYASVMDHQDENWVARDKFIEAKIERLNNEIASARAELDGLGEDASAAKIAAAKAKLGRAKNAFADYKTYDEEYNNIEGRYAVQLAEAATNVKDTCTDKGALHTEYQGLSEFKKLVLRGVHGLVKSGVTFDKIGETLASTLKAIFN